MTLQAVSEDRRIIWGPFGIAKVIDRARGLYEPVGTTCLYRGSFFSDPNADPDDLYIITTDHIFQDHQAQYALINTTREKVIEDGIEVKREEKRVWTHFEYTPDANRAIDAVVIKVGKRVQGGFLFLSLRAPIVEG